MTDNPLDNLRHSCAHLLAAAIEQLYPNAKRTIGPPIDNGFYYDFDFGTQTVSDADFSAIEEKMRELLPSWNEFTREEASGDEAKKGFAGNPYKLELIDEFSSEGQTLTLYTCGGFSDLCRGGHSEHPSKELAHFKLLSVAGAYWRGSEKNKMLTRIYGTCFASKAELEAHLAMLEEAKKRDHRKLGKELDLFVFSDLVGSGLPLFTPRGATVRKELENYISELRTSGGYERVWIPHIAKSDLYKTSGHWDKFEDDLFHVRSKKTDTEFVLKPMNCPHHIQLFASRERSYREMPVRYFENTTIYRDENVGQLMGLTRVRSITQDDSHVFCRADQIENEVEIPYGIISTLYKTIGMELSVRLSTHDPEKMDKYLGTLELWDSAVSALTSVLKKHDKAHSVGVGEAAFYGPKLDFMGIDSLGRQWQLATIQLDVNQPARFKLSFINAEGKEEQPVMIHVAVLGSVERFMGVMLEHTAGNLPVWLSPVQVAILPVSTEKHLAGAQAIAKEFSDVGIRVEIDSADETVGKKIRNSAKQKVPYVLVVGDKEIGGGDFMVRVRGQEEQVAMSKEDFIDRVKKEIVDRTA